MIIKSGVKFRGISPELVLALMIADRAHQIHTSLEMVITSITEGTHGFGSLHYIGQAFDVRTRDTPDRDLTDFVEALRNDLGEDFDVVVEGTHVHVEFQPKTPMNG